MYIQYVQRDVFLAGVIRGMNENMRSDLYDSFKHGHLNGKSR